VEIFVDSTVQDIHTLTWAVMADQNPSHRLCCKSHLFRSLKRRTQSSTELLQFRLQVKQIKAFHRMQLSQQS